MIHLLQSIIKFEPQYPTKQEIIFWGGKNVAVPERIRSLNLSFDLYLRYKLRILFSQVSAHATVLVSIATMLNQSAALSISGCKQTITFLRLNIPKCGIKHKRDISIIGCTFHYSISLPWYWMQLLGTLNSQCLSVCFMQYMTDMVVVDELRERMNSKLESWRVALK